MTETHAQQWATHRAALEAYTAEPYELIVVDNGSTYPPAQTTTAWLANRGIAPAWNEGRRHARGDVLCFLTATTEVTPGWSEPLVVVARRGRYITMPYTNGIKAYGGLGVTGWCWVLTRELADEIGPFDETFVPIQYEDTDFYHRAIYEHGVELVNVPASNVRRHPGPKSYQSWPQERINWIHWANRFRYGFKHGVDPQDIPPFWKQPLRDVEVPVRSGIRFRGDYINCTFTEPCR